MQLKKYVLSLLTATFQTSMGLLAQFPTRTTMSLEGYVNRSGKYLMQLGDDSEVLGSPYLSDSFTTGYLHIEGDWYKGADLRYDAYSAVFEVRLDDGIFVISPESLGADSIFYNDDMFVLKDILPGDMMRLQYVSLLYSGEDYELIKKYRIRLNNAVPTDGYSEAKPAEYRTNPPEYMVVKNHVPTDVKGVRSLADFFSVDRKTVRRYLKRNDYNLNNEKDLVEVVRHFASQNR
jgi:hypothetical protein